MEEAGTRPVESPAKVQKRGEGGEGEGQSARKAELDDAAARDAAPRNDTVRPVAQEERG